MQTIQRMHDRLKTLSPRLNVWQQTHGPIPLGSDGPEVFLICVFFVSPWYSARCPNVSIKHALTLTSRTNPHAVEISLATLCQAVTTCTPSQIQVSPSEVSFGLLAAWSCALLGRRAWECCEADSCARTAMNDVGVGIWRFK